MNLKIEAHPFQTPGYLKLKLPKEYFDRIKRKVKETVKNKNNKINNILAGNISNSFNLDDKKWFEESLITPCISIYNKAFNKFSEEFNPAILNKDCKFYLDRLWVNFQKKNEFNPIHNHSGLYSFVIWVKIPYDCKKEYDVSFVKHSNSPSAGKFSFIYLSSLGRISAHAFELNKDYEGTMVFFPSQLQHVVYPFYSSNKERISISGNVMLDVDQPICK